MDRYEDHRIYKGVIPIVFHLNWLTKGYPLYVHWHENIEILYVVEGEGVAISGNERRSVRAGDVAVINSSMIHSIEATSDVIKYYCLIVQLDFLKSNGIDMDNRFIDFIVRDEEVNRILDEIVENDVKRPELYVARNRARALELMILLFCRHSKDKGEGQIYKSETMENIKKTIRIIREKYNESITVADLAEEVGVSKYYLCHIFKEITGYTIVQYINYIRCDEAGKIIKSGELNVSEAAMLCGFENLSYFTKTFKKYMGLLPKDIRKR